MAYWRLEKFCFFNQNLFFEFFFAAMQEIFFGSHHDVQSTAV